MQQVSNNDDRLGYQMWHTIWWGGKVADQSAESVTIMEWNHMPADGQIPLQEGQQGIV